MGPSCPLPGQSLEVHFQEATQIQPSAVQTACGQCPALLPLHSTFPTLVLQSQCSASSPSAQAGIQHLALYARPSRPQDQMEPHGHHSGGLQHTCTTHRGFGVQLSLCSRSTSKLSRRQRDCVTPEGCQPLPVPGSQETPPACFPIPDTCRAPAWP